MSPHCLGRWPNIKPTLSGVYLYKSQIDVSTVHDPMHRINARNLLDLKIRLDYIIWKLDR